MSVDLTKKPGFNKPLGGDVVFQAYGAEMSSKALRDKAVDAVTANPEAGGLKINSIDIYAKPEEGMCYYVAHNSKRDVSGSFPIA